MIHFRPPRPTPKQTDDSRIDASGGGCRWPWRRALAIAALGGSLALAGCSDSSDGSPSITQGTPNQGVFLNSAVEGLRFETETESGVTDAQGTFFYRPGEIVSFYLGSTLLGSAEGAPVLTPVSLFPGAAGVNDRRVTNLSRLLQTLDDDGIHDNGIQIVPRVFDAFDNEALDLDQPIGAFEGSVAMLIESVATAYLGGPRDLVLPEVARSRLAQTLASLDPGPDDPGPGDPGPGDPGPGDPGPGDPGPVDPGPVDPGPGPDDGVSAAACFPTPLLTTGNVLIDEQRTTTPQDVSEIESTVTVAGPDTFNGQSVIRVLGNIGDEDSGVVANFEFFFSQGDGAVVLTRGQRSEASPGPGLPAFTSEQTFNPPLVERYDLNPGEGFDQSYQVISETTAAGTAQTSTQSVDVSTTYVGRETVTVPAGTFSTCRYEQTQTVTPAPIVVGDQEFPVPATVSEISVWYAVGSGFPVRRVEVAEFGATTNELLSFSINGVPVTGN